MKREVLRILGVCVIVFTIWNCSSDNSSGGDPTDDGTGMTDDDGTPAMFDRAAMLANWADNIIIPSYEAYVAELASLQSSYDTFKADPSEVNLTALRDQWIKTYKSWQYASMFETGPAEDIGFRLNINTYPTDPVTIEDHIATGSYNLSLPDNRDTKGFPALDYLINGIGDTDMAIVEKYSLDANKDAYLTYIDDLLADMTTLSNQVLDDWKQTYRDTFVNNDGSSATASVDRMVNDYIFYYEKFLRAGKMGIPLGVFSGTPEPQTLEAFYYPELGNELFLDGLNAVQDFFNGKHLGSSTTGESLASYLQDLNSLKDGEALDELINNQMNTAREMVGALGTFKDEINNNSTPTQMLQAYDEVQRVVPLFKVDMVSAMSISIDFVDADGD